MTRKSMDGRGAAESDDGAVALETMTELTRPAMAALNTFNGTFLQNAAACQKEWLRFLNLRVKENLAMPAKLSACRSLPELQTLYVDYWTRAVEDYQKEYQALAQTAMGQSGSVEKQPLPNGRQVPEAQPPQRTQQRYEVRDEAH